MSISYTLFKTAVKLLGIKKMTSLPEEELIRKSRQMQGKAPFRIPKDDAHFTYRDYISLEKFHTVQICPAKTSGNRAVLYLYGGGMMIPPAKRYFEYAKQMASLTGRDVWFAYYPLCADYTMLDAVLMVQDVYQKMLAFYAPDHIAFYGFSSGAGLLANLLMYNQTVSAPLPKPELFVGIAPGGCPENEEVYQKMLALNDRDIEVDAHYMPAMRSIMTKGQDVPEYMITGEGGDYTGFPETWLYYGSEEILSAKAESYRKNLDAAGIRNHIVIREGMCHCYCIAKKFPEAAEDYDAIITLLSGNKSKQ